MPLFAELIWFLYGLMCVLLFAYGVNSYVLITLFRRRKKDAIADNAARAERFAEKLEAGEAEWPRVLTQLPVYNELNVAERVIRAAAAMEYPEGRHEIQVLDDSTDETVEVVDRVAAELQAAGKRVTVIRRPDRRGFKAGALNAGLDHSDAPVIAIFDSDFVPNPDFLLRSVPQLVEQAEVALVQARWGHLNADESWLTRSLAIGIDGHFGVEQPARAWNQLYLNFNGTAGVWRRAAIEDAGGWEADTLTEDMDLSYRAQLNGWRIHYLFDVAVPAELPNTFAAFKSQQFRWAKGSIQTAIKLLPRVLRAPGSPFKKVQSVFHLTHYYIHLCMVSLAVLALPLLFAQQAAPDPWVWVVVSLPILLSTAGPSLLYIVSQFALDPVRARKQLPYLPGLILIGFGISLSNARAVIEALLGRRTEFIRTPKRGLNSLKTYSLPRNALPWVEISLGLYCVVVLALALALDRPALGPFILVYIVGYLMVGGCSILETRRQ